MSTKPLPRFTGPSVALWRGILLFLTGGASVAVLGGVMLVLGS